jgi:hypothetical protein
MAKKNRIKLEKFVEIEQPKPIENGKVINNSGNKPK